MNARSFALANDAKIVRSRDAQCKTRELPEIEFTSLLVNSNVISSEKRYLISIDNGVQSPTQTLFGLATQWRLRDEARERLDSIVFPAYWILIGQFKFPARQPYARPESSLFKLFLFPNEARY